jgi:hypothetical protein
MILFVEYIWLVPIFPIDSLVYPDSRGASRAPASQLVRLQGTESLCRKFLKFVAVAQLHPETIQNIVLAAIDGGLIGAHRIGHLDFCAFLPKQLFDQSSAVTTIA